MPSNKSGLVVIGNTLETFGGGERWVLETSMLFNSEIDITIINPMAKASVKRRSLEDLKQAYPGTYKIVGIPCVSKYINRAHFLMMIPKLVGIWRINEAVKKNEVVYLLSMNPFLVAITTFYAKLYCKRLLLGLGNPLLLRCEELPDLRQSWKEHLLQHILLSLIDEIHVQAESQQRVLKAYGYKGKAWYCPQPIWPRTKPPALLPHQGFRCLFVGRLDIGQKGINYLVEIIDKVLETEKGITFDIIGSGEGSSMVEALAARHPRQVKYHGFLPDEKLEEYYQNSDLLLLTSKYETPSLVLLEGQAWGLPAVCFDVQGPNDIIKKSVQGTLIKPFDVALFAEAVIKESKKKSITRKAKIKKIIGEKYSQQKFKRRFKKMIIGE